MQLEDNQACNYVNCRRLTSILQQSDRISPELLTRRGRNRMGGRTQAREKWGSEQIDEQLRLVSLNNNDNTVVQPLKSVLRGEC